MKTGAASGAPRRRSRRRQDLHDARGGQAPPRRRPRRRRGLRRDARPGGDRRRWSTGSRSCRAAPRRTAACRSTEMDVDAVLARKPEIALVDELAHTNAPGSRHPKRWQDVEDLLAAGIDVHLDGEHPAHRVARRRRAADHGRAAARDDPRLGAALRRPDRGRSTSPRRRCAIDSRADSSTPPSASTPRCRTTSGSATSPPSASSRCCGSPTRSTRRSRPIAPSTASTGKWEARERVVVALTGGPEGETLLRRGARIAARSSAAASCSPCTSRIPTACGPGIRGPSIASAPSSSSSAAPSTRSSARTCRERSSTSRGRRMPRSWSSASAADPASPPRSPGRASARP